ncbi:hypothetical protein ACFQT4_19145 [Pseudoduganella danionis]|uniref:hypothetical protein n=1 Tax=Pseudoduganella danionis TaxID=1890295 RepID=UPI0036191911
MAALGFPGFDHARFYQLLHGRYRDAEDLGGALGGADFIGLRCVFHCHLSPKLATVEFKYTKFVEFAKSSV